METLGRITAVLLAAILLFLFPLRYNATLQRQIREEVILQELINFVEHRKVEKKITKLQYQDFMDRLHGILDGFTVELICYREFVYAQGETKEQLLYTDVENRVMEESVFLFEKGDYVTIRILHDADGVIEQLESLFIPTGIKVQEYVYGGMIP
ncbi:hypothetical protein [Lachnoclostridium phytofermentans]|uniref:Uncharacterized protein n=1 Tax=Lachnoclostridium phytofermentans (strain ATCC 700394 / DSM 18823 / ISDg) TaxID=357809 RepID=A9KKQ7_LACP7|nr:hypothetical protein [Lachnoclostridium phytofermentans]ABX41228.1 hypothetical protein Cphy_0841 [Lachnoclostridium phytofermentans ISDg]